ncbi:sporulation-specific protein 2, partial [Scheffersomyces xylosifermentans]|uniref:sporulation-specific protein 2 n=1 Tax=Scheffersomyces xylosifermentans TaxID=1304137 RepID=UPI00315D91FB
ISRESIPSKCKKDFYEIKSPSDVRAISDCKIIAGDINITEFKHPLLSFGEIETIVGSLTIRKCPELVRFEAPELSSISQSFTLKELTSLSLVSLPSLRSVNVLDWRVLPILSNVHLSNEIRDIESITVSDTSLTGFAGFLSNKLEILDINNNRFLQSITSNVEQVDGKLHIGANQADVVVTLPKLKSANNVSFHDIADLNLGSLEMVNGSVSFFNNHFSNLKLPKLRAIGGTLSLLKNDKLNHVEFPAISEIGGGLVLVNNTSIDKVNFFPKLTMIGGAIEMVGNIKETSLKQLKLVKGSAQVHSTATSFDCAKWSKSEISSVVRGGKIECINANNERIVANTPTEGGTS